MRKSCRMQACMREASEVVLAGFLLRSEPKIVRYPDRYSDPRGERFWATVWGLLGDAKSVEADTDGGAMPPITGDTLTPLAGDTPAFPSSFLS